MGLDFSKAAVQQPVVSAVPDTKEEIAVVEQYDIVADREQMNTELVNSPEVDALVSTIEIDNLRQSLLLGRRRRKRFQKLPTWC